MLYGIRTSDRDTSIRLADKNRYLPWNGGAMEGRMELDFKGRRIVIERSSTRSGVMQGFSAYCADTGEPLKGYNGSNAGDLLVGLSRDAFERSVFVGNSGLSVGSSDELERKIRSLASSGDEDVSFADAYATLNKWARERRYHKNGLLPAAEEEYAEISRKLEESDTLSLRRLEAEGAIAALSDEAEKLVRSINIKKASHAREEIKHVQQTKAQSAEKQAEAKRARDMLFNNGFEISRSFISGVRQIMRNSGDTSKLRADTESLVENAKSYENAAETDLTRHAQYGGRFPDEIEAEADRDLAEASELAKKKVKGWLFALTVLFGGVGAAIMLLPEGTWSYESYRAIIAAAAGGGALLALVGGIVSAMSAKKAKGRIAELCASHGCTSPAEIKGKVNTYRDAFFKRQEAAERRAAMEKRLGGISEGIDSADSALNDLLALAGWERDDFSVIEERLKIFEERISEYERVSREAELIGVRYETMVASADMGTLSREASFASANDDYPDRTVQDLQARLEELDTETERRNGELTYVRAREAVIGDRIELITRKKELEKEMERLAAEYDAIDLAAKALEAANTELTGRLTPELNRRASTIFARFTGGKYLDVKIKKGFEALAGDGSAAALRSILSLSSGTSDQL
jgi:uncharacterized protein YhaN